MRGPHRRPVAASRDLIAPVYGRDGSALSAAWQCAASGDRDAGVGTEGRTVLKIDDAENSMALQVVGAGFPRTGTTSLKMALERLLGVPCYHMRELAGNLDHAMVWRDAFEGAPPDWDAFLAGYAAGVDWPISRFWRELAEQYPDAIVLLSRRESPERWYASMDGSILLRARALARGAMGHAERDGGGDPPWLASATQQQMRAMDEVWHYMGGATFADPDDRAAVTASYEEHLAEVRAEVPAERLLEWQPGDGWEPLCAALGVPVPDEPFPHENTAAEMAARAREFGMTER